MISAHDAKRRMVKARQEQVNQRMYAAMDQGFIGVVISVELVSSDHAVYLEGLGFKVFPVPATEEHDPGIKITWSEKV